MKSKTDEEKIAALAACVSWAINFMNTKSGGGLVVHRNGDDFKTEAWITWFQRELKNATHIEYDQEVLQFQRASKADRKRMLKESATLRDKLTPVS